MTRKTALALGIGASLVLAAGTASANCATEVHALQQQLDAIDMPTAAGTTEMSATTTDPTVEDRLSQSGTGINPTYSSNDPGEPAVHDQVLSGDEPSDTMTSDSSTTVTSDATDSPPIGTDQSGTGVNPTWSSNDPGEPEVHDDILYGDAGDTSGTVGTGTITETTRSGEIIVDPADSRSVAISSLKKAQLYADAGQEEACMVELDTARQHLGID